METNIIKAIINVVRNPITEIKNHYVSHNRANNVGEALEKYVNDIFADTVMEENKSKRIEILSNYFSYLGNQNNPPDSIIKNGDAIEVKKIESKNSGLALNSSYPKSKLFSNSSMITKDCRNCENVEWIEKDIIYVTGVLKNNKLSDLSMVYGVDFAASPEIYERIKTAISNGILSIKDIEFSETNELGRVNRVDPLGITYLRIRGMWHIENPFKVFNYIYQRDESKEFNFMSLINLQKYYTFNIDDRNKLEELTKCIPNFKITNVKIKTPDNPAKLKEAKLITFSK